METKKVLIIGGVIFTVSASVFAGWKIMNPKASNVSNQGEMSPAARGGQGQSNTLLAATAGEVNTSSDTTSSNKDLTASSGTLLSNDSGDQQSIRLPTDTPPSADHSTDGQGIIDILHAINDNNLAAIQGFINAGVNFNQTIGNSSTPLIDAIQRNHIEIARAILAAPGTDINYPAKDGRIAIHHAASNGSDEMIRILLADEKCARNQVNLNGLTPLQVAAIWGNTSAVKTLLEDSTVDRNFVSISDKNALDLSIENDRFDITDLLLNDHDNRIDKNGMTVLHKIAENKDRDEIRRAARLRILEAFLGWRVIDVNHRDNKGKTALHYAAEVGDPEMILRLIAAGADSAILDVTDQNAVDYARKREPALKPKYLEALNSAKGIVS